MNFHRSCHISCPNTAVSEPYRLSMLWQSYRCYVNSYDSLIILFNLKLLSEVSDDDVMSILLVRSELCASPTIFKMLDKSLISSILLDWQGNSTVSIKRCNNNDRISTLCFGKLSRTGMLNLTGTRLNSLQFKFSHT